MRSWCWLGWAGCLSCAMCTVSCVACAVRCDMPMCYGCCLPQSVHQLAPGQHGITSPIAAQHCASDAPAAPAPVAAAETTAARS